jgi:hypothetical protein
LAGLHSRGIPESFRGKFPSPSRPYPLEAGEDSPPPWRYSNGPGRRLGGERAGTSARRFTRAVIGWGGSWIGAGKFRSHPGYVRLRPGRIPLCPGGIQTGRDTFGGGESGNFGAAFHARRDRMGWFLDRGGKFPFPSRSYPIEAGEDSPPPWRYSSRPGHLLGGERAGTSARRFTRAVIGWGDPWIGAGNFRSHPGHIRSRPGKIPLRPGGIQTGRDTF